MQQSQTEGGSSASRATFDGDATWRLGHATVAQLKIKSRFYLQRDIISENKNNLVHLNNCDFVYNAIKSFIRIITKIGW